MTGKRGDVVELVDLDDLVGRLELARRAGVKLATIDTWRRRYPDFPEPLRVISSTPLWSWAIVDEWIRTTPREAGRPPGSTSTSRPDGATHPLPGRLAGALRTLPRPQADIDEATEADA